LDQLLARFVPGEARRLLELLAGLIDELLQLVLFGGEGLFAILERLLPLLRFGVALVDLLGTAVERLVARGQPLFVLLNLPSLLFDLLIEFRFRFENRFFALELASLRIASASVRASLSTRSAASWVARTCPSACWRRR
jgi:hypothetical protein